MHTLFRCLDLSNSFNAAVYGTASIAFWSCCRFLLCLTCMSQLLIITRLGELIIPSLNTFDPSRHISRSTTISHRITPGGAKYATFHIPWTKKMHGEGDSVTVSKIDDLTNPYDALMHHISANSAVPPSAPLFAFKTDSGWAPMTRTWFLMRCNNVWKSEGLDKLSGHCFWIRGATELLLRGTPPDIVAVQGCWKSRLFLDYWHHIESILPTFIASSMQDSRISLIKASMDLYECRYR